MTGAFVMMQYQVYQLYQAERTKTATEIRCADEQAGELSRALSSVWHRTSGRHREHLHAPDGHRPSGRRLPVSRVQVHS
jgi:hypothetical protein